MSREKILFDMVDLNKESDSKKRTEMAGIKRMNDIVVNLGGFVRAPKRQNETLDSVIVLGDKEIGTSNKTATKPTHGDGNQRCFPLLTAPFNSFCSFVAAFYKGSDKFAVVRSAD